MPDTKFTVDKNQIRFGMGSIKNNAGIVKKVYFPREILPISVVTSGLVNFLISCLIILIFVILGGLGITWHLVFLPFIIIVQCLFTLALIFVLSAFNVYVKDVEYIVAFIINMLFYATPILYTTEMFSGPILWLFRLNPLAHLINAYRDVFYVHHIPNLASLTVLFGVCIILIVVGYFIFKKLEKRFAEEV